MNAMSISSSLINVSNSFTLLLLGLLPAVPGAYLLHVLVVGLGVDLLGVVVLGVVLGVDHVLQSLWCCSLHTSSAQ